jgi:alkanesulfonate monooxygenase SsuD/methylene tetrahydromethanopterin reductase-like flavin-dependent oxidoreductase (luciferase family)
MKIDVILGAGTAASEVESLGELADGFGIHTLWGSSFPSRRDPLLMMAGLTGSTRKIRLGAMPVSPYEVHPLRIADSLMTFNEMCGGRASILIGGLGHSVMRVTGLTPDRRVQSVRDCLHILKGISPDRMLEYEGDCYTLTNYRPEWATDSPPLVYVGATGPNMLAMSAGIADGVMMSDVPLRKMPEVLESIDRGLADGGRTRPAFRVNNFFAWHIKRDREESMREARRELVWRGLLQKWHTSTFLSDEDAEFVESNRGAFLDAFLAQTHVIEGVPDALVDALVENLTFSGGIDAIDGAIEHLRAFENAGLDEVALKVHGDPAGAIRMIGERLVPALA